MQDMKYLLSIKELLEESTKELLEKTAYSKLDYERRQKAINISNEKKKAESIGAGLLIQLGLQQIYNANKMQDNLIQLLTVSQVLAKLGEPIEVAYKYGEKGKPYFRDLPWYFNVSHSEEYVLCVFSEQEVGVDIQYKRVFSNERILQRFFTREEQEMWKNRAMPQERNSFFYRMWTAKEALGKLTGEGIGKTVSVNVTDSKTAKDLGVAWEFYGVLPQFEIAICKRQG